MKTCANSEKQKWVVDVLHLHFQSRAQDLGSFARAIDWRVSLSLQRSHLSEMLPTRLRNLYPPGDYRQQGQVEQKGD